MEEQNSPNTGFSELISVGKDTVSLLRDASLFVLAVLLIIFPTRLNSILVSAGFEEGSVVGFKWKKSLVVSDAALKEAQATITALQQKNDQITKALVETQTKLNDPALKANILKLEEENKRLNASTQAVQASVSNTIDSNATLVDRALSTTDVRWGVVFGGDPRLKDAEYETKVIAPQLGIPNASIFFRQNSFRSVSRVKNQELAKEVLRKAQQRRQDAYIVDMNKWCLAPATKQDYTECSGS